MRYVLGTFVIESIRWLDRYGRRAMTLHEQQAWMSYYRALGARLGIRDIPDDLAGFAAFNAEVEQRRMQFAPSNRVVGQATLDLLLGFYLPRRLFGLGRPVALALMDAPLLAAMGLPEPPPPATGHGAPARELSCGLRDRRSRGLALEGRPEPVLRGERDRGKGPEADEPLEVGTRGRGRRGVGSFERVCEVTRDLVDGPGETVEFGLIEKFGEYPLAVEQTRFEGGECCLPLGGQAQQPFTTVRGIGLLLEQPLLQKIRYRPADLRTVDDHQPAQIRRRGFLEDTENHEDAVGGQAGVMHGQLARGMGIEQLGQAADAKRQALLELGQGPKPFGHAPRIVHHRHLAAPPPPLRAADIPGPTLASRRGAVHLRRSRCHAMPSAGAGNGQTKAPAASCGRGFSGFPI